MRQAGQERILVVGAHPDDADFGAGGTVALWTDSGAVVTYLVATDGQEGGPDRVRDGRRLAQVRRLEQRAAAAALGVSDVRFLGGLDGRLTPSHELVAAIAAAMARLRPHRVVTHSPERDWGRIKTSHPDHLATGDAVLRALFQGAGHIVRRSTEWGHCSGVASSIETVWMFGSPTPNTFIDFTELAPRKAAALSAHASQVGLLGDLFQLVQARGRRTAAAAGFGPDVLMEAFNVVRVD